MSIPNDEQDEQTKQAQAFIDDLWQSFVADHGGRVTAALLDEWRYAMGPMFDCMTAKDEQG
jgi:hypothetical protein